MLTIQLINESSSSSSASTACDVCIQDYTADKRRKITCPGCNFECCMACARNFLLGTSAEPHCMNCRRAWNRVFLYDTFPHSFVDGDLKKHRSAVIFDREKSLLPATQEFVEYELEARRRNQENHVLLRQIKEMKENIEHMQHQLQQNMRYIHRVVRGENPNRPAGGEAEPEKERRQFVAACPSADCRGFLSQAYKCGTCQKQFCSKCREAAGEEHTCDAGLVATIAEIVKDSRACPSCGIPISRVTGCDQMFCTQCDTAFSYRTGKIEKGVIHNPHYYERLRKLNGGEAPRNADDVPCGGWPNAYDLMAYTERHCHPDIAQSIRNGVQSIIRTGTHVQAVELQETYAIPRVADRENVKLRVRFLLKEIDERELGMTVQRAERTREKIMEIREILENYVILALETAQEIQALDLKKDKGVSAQVILQRHAAMVGEHVNVPLRRIGDLYNNQVPQILYDAPKKKSHTYNQYGAFQPAGYSPAKAKAAKKAATEVVDLTDQ